MEKARFNDLMIRYPNWISEGTEIQRYTFFDGHYTHRGVLEVPSEDAHYRLEYDEVDRELKIEFAATGKRYLVSEELEEGYPILTFTPIDNSGDEKIVLVPKSLKVHTPVTGE